MRFSAALAAAWLAGCSVGPVHVHRGPDAIDHLEYLATALASEPARREQLWRDVLKETTGEQATLHRALLRTVAGHSGYDPLTAESELQGLLAQSPSADIASVARARLEDLRVANACRHEVESLKRRLSKVADIEKRLDQERR
jgi:hypothetical protein